MAEAPFDGTTATSNTITVGQSIGDILDFVGDSDWYSTTLTAGKVYGIIMAGDSNPFDAYLYLRDINGNVIAFNDDLDYYTPSVGDDPLNSTILYKPSTTSTFYIEADSYLQQSTGNYTLSIEEIPAGDSRMGTSGPDFIRMESSNAYKDDVVVGFAGDDDIHGFRGADTISGGLGNDLIRGGNGRDMLTGGDNADYMYGGFGQNRFLNAADGHVDRIVIRSDQFVYNYVYGKDGNSPLGDKADVIDELDAIDQIWIDGVSRADLTVRNNVVHTTPFGEQANGIGIFSKGVLEAVYTGTNLNSIQVDSILNGFDSTVNPLPVA